MVFPHLTRMINHTINLINDTSVTWIVRRSLNVGNVEELHCGWWLNFTHKIFVSSLAWLVTGVVAWIMTRSPFYPRWVARVVMQVVVGYGGGWGPRGVIL